MGKKPLCTIVIPDHFINCDWGTSHFRLRLVDRAAVAVLHELRSEEGTASLAARSNSEARTDVFRTTLGRSLERLAAEAKRDLAALPVLVSGMASSSIGWHEVPYARLPFDLDGRDLIWHAAGPTDQGRISSVYLLSGVRSDRDVMRGEETEAMGLARLPAVRELLAEAILLLPGTHAKHLHVVRGRIVDFQTYMTGELFELLGRQSSLQHSTGRNLAGASQALSLEGPLVEPFCDGVDEGAHRPLPAALFQVRTRQLLHGGSLAANTAYLSGLLIGAELASLEQRWPGSMPIVLAGGHRLHEPYHTALHTLGLDTRTTAIAPSDVDRLSALGQAVVLDRLLTAAIR